MHMNESPEQDLQLRSLRYRLQRLGMLELEEWLGRIAPAIARGDQPVIEAAQQLMQMQTPQLLAMMHAELPLPEVLRPWLQVKP